LFIHPPSRFSFNSTFSDLPSAPIPTEHDYPTNQDDPHGRNQQPPHPNSRKPKPTNTNETQANSIRFQYNGYSQPGSDELVGNSLPVALSHQEGNQRLC
jgi:hypothetical protein